MAKSPLSPAQRLDFRGLRCPMPVLRLEAYARRLPAGTCLHVVTDDPIARVDIPHAMSTAGHACEEIQNEDYSGLQCVFEVTLTGKG